MGAHSPGTGKEPASLQMKKAPEPKPTGRLRRLSRTSCFPYRCSGLQDLLRLHTKRQTWSFSAHRCQQAAELLSKCKNGYGHTLSQLCLPYPQYLYTEFLLPCLAIRDNSLNFQYVPSQWPCFPHLCIFFSCSSKLLAQSRSCECDSPQKSQVQVHGEHNTITYSNFCTTPYKFS